MEKLIRRLGETERALKTLDEILKEPYSVIVRDATIQRFEYTFEVFWKTLKEYLYEVEGIVCNSPKSCFREALSVGLLNDEQTVTCLEMTDDRNLTSHTYLEEVAEKIYMKIKDYYDLMSNVFNHIKQQKKKKL
jgi:nucleotidyltransferase substrate binding protein (TIGR01987 family)